MRHRNAILRHRRFSLRRNAGAPVEGAQAWDTHSYCQRWQIYLTFEQISRRPKVGDLANGGFMALLQGSWYITWFFRRLGATIGPRVEGDRRR